MSRSTMHIIYNYTVINEKTIPFLFVLDILYCVTKYETLNHLLASKMFLDKFIE